MREILFRGKMLAEGRWVEGYFCENIYDQICIQELEKNMVCGCVVIDPETVGQYTGLKDKNGVRIFEGDVGQSIDGVFLVRWSEEKCAFVMDFYSYSIANEELYLEEMWDDSEVIGNIHDNPELLEGV